MRKKTETQRKALISKKKIDKTLAKFENFKILTTILINVFVNRE